MKLQTTTLILTLTWAVLAAEPGSAQKVYRFVLEGGQEVPPSGSAATGVCIARLDAAETELRTICVHDVSNATVAHIHEAPAGSNGGIVFPFPSATSPFRGVWALTPADVAALDAGDLYVNVHSGSFPNGEIRGQIGGPALYGFSFPLEESQEVPPTGSGATGGCDAALNDARTELTTACFHDVSGVTAAHIHNAPAGSNGGIVFPFSSAVSPFLEAWSLSSGDADELQAGNLYVNVHSGTFPNGEIRGQMIAVPLFTDGFESGDTSEWSGDLP